MVREPRSVLREFSVNLGKDVECKVHDSTSEMRYMVLPMRPPETEGWDEDRLIALLDRDILIGVKEIVIVE